MGIAAILLFTLFLYWLGRLLVSDACDNDFLRFFLCGTTGLAITMAAFTVLAALHAFNTTAIIFFGGLAILLCVRRLGRPSMPDWRFLLIFCCVFASIAVYAHHPCDGFDAGMYHLPLARAIAESGSLPVLEYIRFPFFPMGGELLFAFGMMTLGTDFYVNLLATLPLLFVTLGMIGLCLKYTKSLVPGTVAAFALLRLTNMQFGQAYVDALLAQFCFAATVFLQYHLEVPQKRTLLLAGIAAGSALAVKYVGLPYVGLMYIVFCIFDRKISQLVRLGCTMLFVGGFWYARSLLLTGNPFHPFLGVLFGYSIWTAQDVLYCNYFTAHTGVPKNLTQFFSAFASIACPYAPAFLLGVFYKKLRFLFCTCIAFVFFWFFFAQTDRFVVCALPLCFDIASIAIFSVVRLDTLPRPGKLVLSCLCALLLLYNAQTLAPMLDHKLSDIPGYALVREANGQGSTMVNLGFESCKYYFDGAMYGDVFGPVRYIDMLTKDDTLNVEYITTAMKRHHATLLVVSRHVYLIDEKDGQIYIRKSNVRCNPAEFADRFTLLAENNDGYLFALKSSH